VEEFYAHLEENLDRGPCIYVLDSMDALSSSYEVQRWKERREAIRKREKLSGDYTDGKAKSNSTGLRAVLGKVIETDSILIIVNQTRDNIASPFGGKTRSGGHALSFYAALEIWSSVDGKIQKVVRGKKRTIGIVSKLTVKKNRVTGKVREVSIPIFYSYGIDDLGSCVDYLVTEGHWKKGRQGSISAPEFDFKGKRDRLLAHIEENSLETKLRKLVAKVWREVEERCEVKRKPRFS